MENDRHRGAGPPPDRRSLPRRVAIHAGGALVTVGLWTVLIYAQVLVAFVSSVCGRATASDVRTFRIEVLVLALIGSLIPLLVGLAVRRLGEHAQPWFALAAVVAVIAVILGVSVRPSQWCF